MAQIDWQRHNLACQPKRAIDEMPALTCVLSPAPPTCAVQHCLPTHCDCFIAGTKRRSLRRLMPMMRAQMRRRRWCTSEWRHGRRWGHGRWGQDVGMQPATAVRMLGLVAGAAPASTRCCTCAHSMSIGSSSSEKRTTISVGQYRWRSRLRRRRVARPPGWPKRWRRRGSASGVFVCRGLGV